MRPSSLHNGIPYTGKANQGRDPDIVQQPTGHVLVKTWFVWELPSR